MTELREAYTVKWHGLSHVGKVRTSNQDSILCGDWLGFGQDFFAHGSEFSTEHGLVFAIADGIGGHKGGDYASKFVLQAIKKLSFSDMSSQSVAASMNQISRLLAAQMLSRPDLWGMGSTVAGISVKGAALYHFNIGDSRVYRLRNRQLTQLSVDDSASGTGILTQAVGGDPRFMSRELNPHAGKKVLKHGDVYLICSDGLTAHLDNSEIRMLLLENADDPAQALLAEVLERGARDNISVVVLKFQQTGR